MPKRELGERQAASPSLAAPGLGFAFYRLDLLEDVIQSNFILLHAMNNSDCAVGTDTNKNHPSFPFKISSLVLTIRLNDHHPN